MWTANEANKRLVLLVRIRFGSVSITTTVSFLANEGDVLLRREISLSHL